LLAEQRDRLKRMVAARLDRRLAARVDPSDIVQEAMLDAAKGFDQYLSDPPLPLYPWLRQFARQRLIQAQRHHITRRRRSVTREVSLDLPLADASIHALADRLMTSRSSPSRRIVRGELLQRMHAALDALSPGDREILVMRHLEQMSSAEIASALGISEPAVWQRHLRALKRLRKQLDDGQEHEE
jgi:RNA polymerase sigma-70 factor (ECF subfamily)